MSVFDLIVLTILIALAFRGWMTGMVAQIVSVASFAVSWLVASRFAFLIAPSIPAEEPWNQIGAMIVLFAITLVAIRLSKSFLEKKIKDWNLAKLNWYLGGLLGLAKGLLVCMVLTFFGVMVSETTRDVIFKSKTGNHLVRLIGMTGAFIPSDSYELLHKQLALFDAKVNGTENKDEALDVLPEEKSLQKMIASLPKSQNIQEIKEKGESSFNNLVSQGNSLFETTKNLKQQTDQASSLLDAIGRWWSGSDKTEKIETTPSSTNNGLSENLLFNKTLNKTLNETLDKTPSVQTAQPATSPVVTSTEPISRSSNLQNSPPIPPIVTIDPPKLTEAVEAPKTDGTLAALSAPASSEGALFRRQRRSETNQPIAGQLEALRQSSSDSELTAFTATPMSIPRSSVSFRFSKPFSGNSTVETSDRLLNSLPTQVPATLFTPKR